MIWLIAVWLHASKLHQNNQHQKRENLHQPIWLKETPAFMKLREIDLYAILQRDSEKMQFSSDNTLANFNQRGLEITLYPRQ